jgi:hypothetical protein
MKMRGRALNETKEEREAAVFARFLSTQSPLKAMSWKYTGSGHWRPDFVSSDGVGVELAEWLHESQTRTAREIEKFEQEIISAAEARHLKPFLKSFDASELPRYVVVVHVRKVPRQRGREEITKGLLDFLVTCDKPRTAWELRNGRTFGQAELPKALGHYFATVHIGCATANINLGLSIARGGSFASEDAVEALLTVMRDKLETKQNLYQKTRRERQLEALHLLVHYGRGFVWNTPYHGIGLREGRSLDEPTSRQVISEHASRYAASVDGGAFDRIFLLFDLGIEPDCRLIWPVGG